MPLHSAPDARGGLSRTATRPAYRAAQILIGTIFRTLFGLKVRGAERVPMSGPFILASNHKSWFDPPVVGSACPREIAYAAKKELFTFPLLGRFVRYYNSIPVRRGGFDREALIRLEQWLEQGGGIIIFPEGTRFLDEDLHPPKLGVGLLAVQSGAPIVPVRIRQSHRLGSQLFRRGLSVAFGEPFRATDLGIDASNGKEGYQRLAEEVMRRIREM
ncbi:MAG: 1-acyl-sn-glycerol-3-phosphate acyltransferase [Calditrichaeota bacterium]|nr:1-acyl-sn-glycerol-3-phosphate acyltransferase [Calditrichota bacterium]